MDYGKAIRTARAAKGLTQQQLGELVQRDASYISRLEAGNRAPSVDTLNLLAGGLSMPVYLLTLLASESDDLHGMPEDVAQQLGSHLLQAVIKIQEQPN